MMIELPPALERLVKDKVSSGLYASESEVVRHALRHEFTGETVEQWVRQQVDAGFAQLDNGESQDITRGEILARLAQRRAA